MWTWLYLKLGLAAARVVPRRWALGAAGAFGALVARCVPRRRVVRDNLSHVLGPDSPLLAGTVRRVFAAQARNYVDLLYVPRWSQADIQSLVRIDPPDLIPATLARGKGLVMVAPHVGNLDVTAQLLGLAGVPALAIVERLRPERLFRLVSAIRSQWGVRLVPVDEAARAALRALARGELVFTAADRDVTGGGIVVDLYGEPARLPDGYARIAVHAGAPVLVAGCRRLDDGRFVMSVQAIDATDMPAGDGPLAVRQVVEAVARRMELIIAADPGQWVLFEPVWRAR